MIQIFHHRVDKLYPNNWFQLAATMTHFYIIIFYFFIYYLKYRNLNYTFEGNRAVTSQYSSNIYTCLLVCTSKIKNNF